MKTIRCDKNPKHAYENLNVIFDFLLLGGSELARDCRWGQNRTG